MNQKILLIEPNYKNKYPPIGLMKIATYHRRFRGDHVRFFKGDLKDLAVELLTDTAISRFMMIQPDIDWSSRRPAIFKCIRYNRQLDLAEVTFGVSENLPSIYLWLKHFSKSFRSGNYDDCIKWDRIYVSTLFTFYWDLTVNTVLAAKKLLADSGTIWVGGVMATVAPDQFEAETGVKPVVGLLDRPGILYDDSIVVDELPLDYSILHETDYKYPEAEAYYGYMTRGCVRRCRFCAVPTLEPQYKNFLSISHNIDNVAEEFGSRRNLLLLDNNVLASDRFDEIIQDIKTAGFSNGAVYVDSNMLEIAIKNLNAGTNDYGYTRLAFNEIINLSKRLKGETLLKYNDILRSCGISPNLIASKEVLLEIYPKIAEIYEKYRKKSPKRRYVDFNQGVDARFVDDHKMELLSEIPIKPLRIAFDRMSLRHPYENAVRLAAKYRITHLSNYLLYNYEDEPIELYQRLKLNVELCEELGLSIYSFPMKYNPINDADGYYKNREFTGKHWNRKFIRAIQLVLNATKGKIGRGRSFFEEAFGATEQEYFELLYMPENYIFNRMRYKHNGTTQAWRDLFRSLTPKQRKIVYPVIESNCVSELPIKFDDSTLIKFIDHYRTGRDQKEKVSTLAETENQSDLSLFN